MCLLTSRYPSQRLQRSLSAPQFIGKAKRWGFNLVSNNGCTLPELTQEQRAALMLRDPADAFLNYINPPWSIIQTSWQQGDPDTLTRRSTGIHRLEAEDYSFVYSLVWSTEKKKFTKQACVNVCLVCTWIMFLGEKLLWMTPSHSKSTDYKWRALMALLNRGSCRSALLLFHLKSSGHGRSNKHAEGLKSLRIS